MSHSDQPVPPSIPRRLCALADHPFPTWFGTSRRLAVGFGALTLILVVTSQLTLSGLRTLHETTLRVQEEQSGIHLSLELASAIRDQYAHQAHTIIIGNASHLGLYTHAQVHVLKLTRSLRAHARAPTERAWMDDIEAASAELDHLFRAQIVPAVLRHDLTFVQIEHARAQLLVSRIQDDAERLVDSFQTRIAAMQASAWEVERRTNRWLLIVLIGTPILALGIALAIGRSVARPLAQLGQGAAHIAQGDLDARIAIASRDEFGALATQFNAMTTALKEHQTRLIESEKLAGVGRLAAGVAHEINNPLGVILGYTRILRKRGDATLAEDLAVIEEETLRCKEIVEGLLDLSRPAPTGRDRVDLRAIADEVASRCRELTEGQGGPAFEIEGAAFAFAHASKIRQVLTNLVRNASEAAGPGGHVRILLRGSAERSEVCVKDSGPGLDDHLRARLFEPFFTTKAHGTGLGLAISRAIARAYGGDVTATNALDGGAIFTLSLPTFTERAP